MKNRLIIFLLVLMVLASIPNEVFAQRVATFQNNTSQKIFVAMHYKHSSSGWLTQGWWGVEPNSSRDITFASENNIVYILAKNDKSDLYWEGEKSNKDDRSFYVVSDSFKALGQNKPSGKNLSREIFFYVEFEDEQFTYEFDR